MNTPITVTLTEAQCVLLLEAIEQYGNECSDQATPAGDHAAERLAEIRNAVESASGVVL